MRQLGEDNTGPHRQEFNPFLSPLSGGAMLVAHKTGSFQKPPAPLVQHEVRVQDGPSQPQPWMTISRSQSPLPPVDWKTYTSSGRKLRPPTSSSPRAHNERGADAGVPRHTAPFLRYKVEGQSRVSFFFGIHLLRGRPTLREAGVLAVLLPQVFRTKTTRTHGRCMGIIQVFHMPSHFTAEAAEAHKGP